MEVKSLIDETHLGIFDNKTGKTNVEEFDVDYVMVFCSTENSNIR